MPPHPKPKPKPRPKPRRRPRPRTPLHPTPKKPTRPKRPKPDKTTRPGKPTPRPPRGPFVQYRIHPAIGIARLGNADRAQFVIGPEVPGQVPASPLKADGKVRPQAARFRIFRYELRKRRWTPVREVRPGVDGVVEIRWTVHLANKKAAFAKFGGLAGEPGEHHDGATIAARDARNPGPASDWIIDPGPRSISSTASAPVGYGPTGAAGERWPARAGAPPPIADLGELRVDEAGRLLVLGGRGTSVTLTGSAIVEYANNPGWLDDVADGPVTATVVTRGADGVPIEHEVGPKGVAWVIAAPPDFAPAVRSTVTLWQLLVDLTARRMTVPTNEAVFADDGAWRFVRELNDELRAGGGPALTRFVPSFRRDVEPILQAGLRANAVSGAASGHHGGLAGAALADPAQPGVVRQAITGYLRAPVPWPEVAGGTMPKLLGDDPYRDHAASTQRRARLAIPPTYYAIMKRWAAGAFVTGDAPGTAITAWGLDQAALDACIGGAFFPGIEVGWQIRHPSLYVAPFRVDHAAVSTHQFDAGQPIGPGHFTRQMAVPWQADFNECQPERHDGTMWGWWPAARPDTTLPVGATASHAWAAWNDTQMKDGWSRLGFVTDGADGLRERERDPTLP